MALRGEELRRAQETTFPERFTDGTDWLGLAEQAITGPATRAFTREEWERATGVRLPLGVRAQQVSSLYALRDAYEALRLRGQFVTVDGLGAVEARAREIADQVREAREPDRARQLRAGLEILTQARKAPAQRFPWSRLLRTLDLAVQPVQLARPRR